LFDASWFARYIGTYAGTIAGGTFGRAASRTTSSSPSVKHFVHAQWGECGSPNAEVPVSSQGVEFERRSVAIDGLITGYLEAGDGDPVILLHGGEFGASAELGWERTIAALARRHRVLAPDMLGYGNSAKVIDFVDGRGMRIRHLARFCDEMQVDAAHFVGNSMGAINLLTDATSQAPVLPVRSLSLICGGGEIQRNEHTDALYEYDASAEGMRRIVTALFFDPAYPADDEYVRRRHESSTAPGAWEAIAAARFRRPGLTPPPTPSTTRAYERITVPTLVIEGAGDKLLPPGWAADIAGRIAHGRSAVVDGAGHCPQIERPDAVNALLLEFLEGSSTP
jgi:pimeloyl-ACP methyl ester carboxylesterase